MVTVSILIETYETDANILMIRNASNLQPRRSAAGKFIFYLTLHLVYDSTNKFPSQYN